MQRLFEPEHAGMLVVERDGMLDGVITRHDVLQELRRISMEETSRL
jgi:predicted transcriptional regulator